MFRVSGFGGSKFGVKEVGCWKVDVRTFGVRGVEVFTFQGSFFCLGVIRGVSRVLGVSGLGGFQAFGQQVLAPKPQSPQTLNPKSFLDPKPLGP